MWWKESVAYQIYPRSFRDSNGDGIGDIQGIIAKLDYLQHLGIDLIWLCPVFDSPNDDNGYDIRDYMQIHEEFGSMADMEQLVQEVHKRGMKLIIDLVINHTSDEHPWFVESRSSKENEKRDWYIWHDGVEGHEPNNWASIFSGSAWEYDDTTRQYYMHLFSPKQPDINWENGEVRQAIYQMMNTWLDKGIDGFRVDAISHIKKRPTFPSIEPLTSDRYQNCERHMMNVEGIDTFLTELKKETYGKRDVVTVGEANGVGLHDAHRWVGEENGYFNMIFQFEHLELWKKGPRHIDVDHLKHVLSKWQYGLEGVGWNALFFENHDQPRSVSAWGDDTTYWKESAKMLALLYFCMKGTPFVYQGQEIGMTNVHFPSIEQYNDISMKRYYAFEREKGRSHEEVMDEVWRNSRDNSRTPMQWNDEKGAGFTTNERPWLPLNPNYTSINVASQLDDSDSVLSFYRQMIALRKQEKVLQYGSYHIHYQEHPTIYCYTREYNGKKALILCNYSSEQHSIPTPVPSHRDGQLVLNNYPVHDESLPDVFHLRPFEARLYLL